MIICDLCGEARDCLQKEIEGKEYDICSECWNPLAQKLRGKGRGINREIVLLPPPTAVKEQEDEERPGSHQKSGARCNTTRDVSLCPDKSAQAALTSLVGSWFFRLVTRIYGLILVPGAARACDIELFPSHRRYGIRKIVWSLLECCR